MPQSFLFPDKLFVAETLQLNVALEDEKLTLNGEEIPWFKDCLNIEQKETVTASLRGECRPQPFIIFGPPVRKKGDFIQIGKYLWFVVVSGYGKNVDID